MRYLLIVLMLSGCVGAGHDARDNRDYARNCGAAMDELGMCRP